MKNKLDQGNSQMVRGVSDSWLFYNFPDNWDQYSGRQGPPNQSVIQGNKTLSEFREQAENAGIVFLSTYIPNKNRIYPEFVPPRYGAISNASYIELYNWDLSLVQILEDGKSNFPMYLQTDTHWTNMAAFKTYEVLIAELDEKGLKLPILSPSKLQPRDMSNFEGDLIKLGGLNPALYPELHPDIIAPPTDPKKVVTTTLSASENPQFRTIVHENSESNETTLVIIGDSFAKLLIPYFNHSFDRVIFIHNELGGFDFDRALKFKPDAMIFAPVERFAEQLSTYPNPLY